MPFIFRYNFVTDVKGDQCFIRLCAVALERIWSNVPENFDNSPVLFFC